MTHFRIEPHHEKAFFSVGTGHLHTCSNNAVDQSLTRFLQTEVIESIPGRKLGIKTEKLEFDPENLAVVAEI